MSELIRFQSVVPNRHGRFPGVFALANGLAQAHRLSEEDVRWWRSANDRATAAYPDPERVAPGCYDPHRNPGARSWFRADALDLLEMAREYLGLLDRYGVGWSELRTRTPGRVVYQDAVQVVAVPPTFEDDWPFTR
ncbi:MAG TPA: hypothetical protein VGC57_03295 [Cellulomonas sp.]